MSKFTTIFIVAFLNLVGFGVIIPLLPYYAETFGADATIIGLLIASYPAAQLISAPLLGRISDRIGRRPVLLYSILGNALAFVIFAYANNLFILFLSRIFSGLMMGNGSVVQAYVSDITTAEERTMGLGRIGAALGLGFIVGPGIGGILSPFGYSVPVLTAAALSILNALAIFYWLPESLDNKKKNDNVEFTVKALRNVLKKPLVGIMLQTRFVFNLAFSMFTTIFALFAQQKLKIDAEQTGYILAYAGFLIVIVQGVVVERLARYINDGTLLFNSVLLMIVSLLGWAYSQSVEVLLIVLIPLSIASGVFRTIVTSVITRIVSEEEMGGILGITLSIDSFTRFIAPGAGGYLMAALGSEAPGLISASLLVIIIPLTYKHFIRSKHPQLLQKGSYRR